MEVYVHKYLLSVFAVLTSILVWYYAVPPEIISQQQGVNQLSGSAQDYIESQRPIFDIRVLVTIFVIALVIVLWRKEIMSFARRFYALIVGVMLVVFFAGCAASKDIYVVESNQTAFLIPLTGNTDDQTQTQSLEYLEQNKVNSQQVIIDKAWINTGGGFLGLGGGEYRPTMKLILVDRSPAIISWTSEDPNSTQNPFPMFRVESKDSQGFRVGIVLSAEIAEKDAAKFLYYYRERDLETVLNGEIRVAIQSILFDQFGDLSVNGAQEQKDEIISEMAEIIADRYLTRGITITEIGGADGLLYDNPAIQEMIDRQTIAESQQEVVAQENIRRQEEAIGVATQKAIENNTLLEQSSIYATATVVAGQAAAQVQRDMGEALAQNPLIIAYEWAVRWDGQLPQFAGSSQQPVPMFSVDQYVYTPTYMPTATVTPVPAQ